MQRSAASVLLSRKLHGYVCKNPQSSEEIKGLFIFNCKSVLISTVLIPDICVPKYLGKRPICSCKNCWQTRQLRGSKVIAACLFWLMCLQETQKHRLTEHWPCAVGDPSSRNLSCSHKHQFHTQKKNQACKTRGPWTSLKGGGCSKAWEGSHHTFF